MKPKICKQCNKPYIPYNTSSLIYPLCQDCINKLIKEEKKRNNHEM